MSNLDTKVSEVTAEVVVSQLTGKKWYMSKTLWANVGMIAAIWFQGHFGVAMSVELQALIMAGVNMALRTITKEPVVW